MENDSIIMVNRGVKTTLAKLFNCSSAYIGQCLNGKYPDSSRAKIIRHAAISQYSGIEMVRKSDV